MKYFKLWQKSIIAQQAYKCPAYSILHGKIGFLLWLYNDLPVVSNHVHEGDDARTPIDKKNKETILSSAQGNNIEVHGLLK